MWEKKLSQKVAKQCNQLGAQQSEAVLAFGLELIIITAVGIGMIIITSLILGHPWLWLPFLAGFAPIRKFAGGFHASTHIRCYIISTLVFLCCALASIYLSFSNLTLIAISIITWLIVFVLSPVAANNKPLKKMQRIRNRKISLLIVSVEAIVAIGLLMTRRIGATAQILFLGAFAASLSLVIAKVNTIKRREDSL